MRSSRLSLGLGISLALLGCSGGGSPVTANTTDPSEGDQGRGDDDKGGDTEEGGDAPSDSDGNDDNGGPGPGNDFVNCYNPNPDEDLDNDGFTPATGDCDECQALINPGAYDFPDNDFDEDCDGKLATSADYECDQGLNIASNDPKDAARAMGLCKFVGENEPGWGVISARFTNSTGKGNLADARQVGLLPEFGAAQPRAGASMLALSSGVARAPGQSGYTAGCDQFAAPLGLDCIFDMDSCRPPQGYPKNSSRCGDVFGGTDSLIFDQAALELKIRVPTNAKSYAFDSIFYTYEYPDYICSPYNDFFVVFQSPKVADLEDENVVFDTNGDPIGVNSGLLAVCNPNDAQSQRFDCEQGTDLLAGTGFGPGEASCAQEGGTAPNVGGASTGWLHTSAPAQPGSVITLRFAIWDTGDPTLDSTVLLDKFEWSVEEPEEVETIPIL